MQKLDCTIVFVSDMMRSTAFYRDVLGIPLRFASAHWTEFDSGGCTLALHLAEGRAEPKLPTPAGCCQLGFHVPDVEAFHQRMSAQHIACLKIPTDESFGKMAIYADPDGLAITIMERVG